jgi:putative membrane-bound dehydrogenase-like protein
MKRTRTAKARGDPRAGVLDGRGAPPLIRRRPNSARALAQSKTWREVGSLLDRAGVKPIPAPLRLLAPFLVLLAYISIGRAGEPAFTLPPGFAIERVAAAPAIQFPMFACLDERRRLFVAESSGLDLYAELQQLTRKCRISVLEDRDGDGRYERAQVFADPLVFPMGLVWREGRLYVADPPDLVTLEDTDGDSRADKRTVLLTGFGHTDNGSLHGLTFGPDGWLYLTMGQPDGYKLRRPDGSFLEGKSGALLRCRPDGADVEVVARGFENLVEVEFMPTGEIIGTDNWFSLPEAGERDALVHLLEGGVYPLHAHAKVEARLFTSGEWLPPLALYPAVALSGIVRYRGEIFPARFRDALFTAQFNARRIVTHRLQRHGATFRSIDEDFLTTNDPDFHPSDVLEDADGSLLVVDTGSWYVHHCPTGRIRKAPARGGIYRVSHSPSGGKEAPISNSETRNSEPEANLNLLASAGGDPDAIARTARALGRVSFPDKMSRTRHFIGDDQTLEHAFMSLLVRPEPHVRLAAAEALARRGSSNAVPALLAALTREVDPFLEHALTYTLHRLADARALTAALEHPHPRVQKAALTLLHQAPHKTLTPDPVLRRLFVEDEPLRRTARKILQQRADWGPHAAPLVQSLVTQEPATASEADALRELILTFQSDRAVQRIVGRSATNASFSAGRREFLMETMARTSLAPLPDDWVAALAQALRAGEPPVRLQAARTAAARQVAALDETLTRLVVQTNLPSELRLEALRATLGRHPRLTPPAFDLLLAHLSPQSAPGARLAAAELLSRAQWADAERDPPRLISLLRGDRLVSVSTVLPLLLRSEGAGFRAAWNYLTATVEQGWQPTDQEQQFIAKCAAGEAAQEWDRLSHLVGQRAATQREQIDAFAGLLTGGDVERGRRWFTEKVGCAACHRVGGQGGLIGPDLTKIGAIRSGRDLIESIVLPSATFAQGYESFTVTLRDGQELTGIRVRQPDDSFVLRDAGGGETRLDPGQVQSVERLQSSLMPEGLLDALTRGETRDLLSYLQSLR